MTIDSTTKLTDVTRKSVQFDQPIPPEAPLYIVPMAGTESWGDLWWQTGSPWLAELATARCFPVLVGKHPFRWSTTLDGITPREVGGTVKNWIRRAFGKAPQAVLHREWEAGGDACFYFLHDLPYAKRNLIAHSHAGQVALYAAAFGTRIRTLVTVGTPVRADMFDVYARARKNIGWHLHICDATFDLWGTLGQLFDGEVSVSRTWPAEVGGGPGPDLTVTLEDIGHSGILRDPKLVDLWVTEGWLALIRLGSLAARYRAPGGVASVAVHGAADSGK